MADYTPLVVDGDDEDNNGGGSDEWIVTFADMCTLLLTFFVLLVSMSTMDKQRFSQSFSSVRETFGGAQMLNVKSEQQTDRDASGMQDSMRERQRVLEAQNRAFSEIKTFLSRSAEGNNASAKIDDGTITLTVPAEVLFAAGSESLLSTAQPFLYDLRQLFLKERQQNINIKGYTDNSPIPANARFHDNWELSALRAVNVLREMLKGGVEPVRLTATGLGDLNPIVPNTTEENKALNRRVEFVLERRSGE